MSSSREILVLQVFSNELRLVQATVSDGAVELVHTCSFKSNQKNPDGSALTDQTTIDGLADYVREHRLAGCELICVLSGSSIACQYYDMPPLPKSALNQAVLLKLSQQLHFPVAEAVVSTRTVGYSLEGDTKNPRIQATAVKRDLAMAATQAADRLGLNLSLVCAGPDALAGFTERLHKSDAAIQAVLHIDERIGTLVILGAHSPCVATELPIAAGDLTAALMRPIISGEKVIQLDATQAAELRTEVGIPGAEARIDSLGVTGDRLLPLLEPALQKFAKQLTQWITYSTTCAGGGVVQSIRLVGPGASIKGLAEAISARINIPVQRETGAGAFIALADVDPTKSSEAFAIPAAAALDRRALPNALPPEFVQQRTMQRIRKSIAIFTPIVAAAVLGFAVLFARVHRNLRPRVQAHEAELAHVRQLADEHRKWAALQSSVRSWENQLNGFARATPHWVGIFKELSLLLPGEVQATEYVAKSEGPDVQITVTAKVFTEPQGRGFNEIATQALLMLQRSTFFTRVEMVSANQSQSADDPRAAGTIALRLDLAYPVEKPRT
jgi:Tfp pilus assembly PilM family ATPase/Tfp pilus assembly protein PilN